MAKKKQKVKRVKRKIKICFNLLIWAPRVKSTLDRISNLKMYQSFHQQVIFWSQKCHSKLSQAWIWWSPVQTGAVRVHFSVSWDNSGHLLEVSSINHRSRIFSIFLKDHTFQTVAWEIRLFTHIQLKKWRNMVLLTSNSKIFLEKSD